MKIAEFLYEIDMEQALQGGLDRGEMGWAVHDVAPGAIYRDLTGTERRALNMATSDQQWRIVDLPLRLLTATQDRINPDYRVASELYPKEADWVYPIVFRTKTGKLAIQDGHHRVAKAARDGQQVVRVRFIDLYTPPKDQPELPL